MSTASTQTQPAFLETRQMFLALIERAYAALTRKPQRLYDLRANKQAPFFEKHVADYRQHLREGADRTVLLDGHELVALEVESLVPDQVSSIPGRAFVTLEEAHQAEVDAECAANPVQLMASRTQTAADLDRSIDVSLTELRALKQLIRAKIRRRNALRMLERQTA